jgi:AcrR family transcriptional regulator
LNSDVRRTYHISERSVTIHRTDMTSQSSTTPTRRYRKRRRAELEAKTRQRITEAAVELHGSVGPVRTTVKAIADRAGVQRATVYRHFPDEESLFVACSAHWAQLNPPPDPDDWAAIADPAERLRFALGELYEWFAWAEPMLVNIFRDASLVPSMRAAAGGFRAQFARYDEALMQGRRERGRRRARIAAAIGHALAFSTWLSLVRDHDLPEGEAVDLMARLIESA